MVGSHIVREEMLNAFIHLLRDVEAEVRSAASGQIPGFSAMIESEAVLKEILPAVKDLVVDGSQHVRAAVATQISGLSPILGKNSVIEHLLPVFLLLLKDEASEVRLNVISKLDKVNEGITIACSYFTLIYQWSALSVCRLLFFQRSLSWPKTSNGEFVWQSLRIFLCSLINLD